MGSGEAAGIVKRSRAAELDSLRSLYEALCARIARFASCRPEVAGVLKLRKRAEKDLQHIQSLSRDDGDTLESARNNAAGLNAELDVVRVRDPLCSCIYRAVLVQSAVHGVQAESLPGVVSVSQRFKLAPPGTSSNAQAETPAAPPPGSPTSRAVEVDVVAAGGSLWVEVKAHAWFRGASSRASGAAPQAQHSSHRHSGTDPCGF